jgi:heme/copper-type cytochrome/quinol oxidase subunit 3
MTCTYAYTPAIWPSLFTVILLTMLAVYAWRRRNLPGASWFVIYCLLGVLFLGAKVIEFLAVDFNTGTQETGVIIAEHNV